MKRFLVVLFLVLLFLVPIVASAQTLADSTVTVATTKSGPTLVEQVAAMFAALTPILGFLWTTGIITKYVPFMAWLPNRMIGWANALIGFLLVFTGPAPAHAGIFGDLVHTMSWPLKIAASGFLAVAAREIHETFGRALFAWIEKKTGLHPAGLTKTEVAERAKLLGT